MSTVVSTPADLAKVQAALTAVTARLTLAEAAIAALQTAATPAPTPTPVPTPTPTPAPTGSGPQGVKPTRANTGPRKALTASSETTLQTAGATYTGIKFGSVALYASGCTFTDCSFDSIVLNETVGTKFDHCTIAGFYAEGHKNTEVGFCFLGDQPDTFMQIKSSGRAGSVADNLNVHDCLFDGLKPSPPGQSHIQAVHLMDAVGAVFRNCVISAVPPDAATLAQMSSTFQGESDFNGRQNANWTLDGCWFYGGSPYMQLVPSGSGLVVTNCAFTTGPSSNPIGVYPAYKTPVTQSGNTLDGKPFNLP